MLNDGMATLLCEGRAVAPIRIATSRRARYLGLLGEEHIDGAVLLLKTNGVHTLGMRFPIDVAYLAKDLRVVDIVQMKPNRWSRNRLTARHTIEAEAGRFAKWQIRAGSRLSVV